METQCDDGVLILMPQGEVGKIEKPSIKDVSEQIRNQSILHVVFDLHKADLISSPGFGWMFGIARECKRLGISVAACEANSVVSRSLKWVNGHLVMSVCKTRNEALQA